VSARGAVYLIPPKKNLTIFHGKLLLTDQDPSRGLNLPIDIFLRSLAEDQGRKAIAVILSGTGSDGMRGIRSVKECGGMVMVQDETSAKFDGMPRSAISTGLADFILPPRSDARTDSLFYQAPLRVKTARAAPSTLVTDEDGLTRIFALLRERHHGRFHLLQTQHRGAAHRAPHDGQPHPRPAGLCLLPGNLPR
jgi:two-component system CheB/CheR fusion protein